MKFLIIAPRFHTNLYYRAKALQNAGHFVKILVLYKGKSEFYENMEVQLLSLSLFSQIITKIFKPFKKNKLKSTLELRLEMPNNELNKIIKTDKPDIILLKAYQNLLAIKTLWITKNFSTKIYMLTQTTKTDIFNSKLLFRLNIHLFKTLGVNAYITPIKSNYEAFKKAKIKNIFYLPFVFPLATKNPNNTFKYYNSETTKLLCIGKFVPRKDQLLLCKATKELLEKGYKIQLTFFGEIADSKYYDTIKKFIMNNNLQNNIILHHNIPYKNILNEYKKHHIFVLPSYNEPAAYSIVEAMAHGLPVICSNQNGTSCYIENEKNGYIFKAKNKEDLILKLEKLISNKKRLKKMQNDSLYLVNKNHNLENFSTEIIKYYLKTNNYSK